MLRVVCAKALLVFSLFFSIQVFADTIDLIKERDRLKCGISTGLVGFSNLDEQGQWQGFDVDFCKAMAVALLGDASKVEYVPLSAKTRFTALIGGEVDILVRNTTWNFTRDNTLGIAFSVVNFYDGQGFMLRESMSINEVKQLSGASICVTQGTTSERNLAEYFHAHNINYKAVYFDRADQMSMSYDAGRCDVMTADTSALVGLKTLMKNPDQHVILKQTISREPLAIATRDNQMRLLKLSRWVLWSMLTAEELGVSQKNIAQFTKGKNTQVDRLLSLNEAACASLSVDKYFVADIIKQVGNYADVFDRNLGSGSALGLSRSLNALWSNGGLQYAPPMH